VRIGILVSGAAGSEETGDGHWSVVGASGKEASAPCRFPCGKRKKRRPSDSQSRFCETVLGILGGMSAMSLTEQDVLYVGGLRGWILPMIK
jgi:hypothetical protein